MSLRALVQGRISPVAAALTVALSTIAVAAPPVGAIPADPSVVSPSSPTADTTVWTTSTNYSESSSRFTYSGTWRLARSSAYLGGAVKYATAKGASATFRFTGISVSWTGPVGPTRGSARVYVNGVYVKAVSQYSSTYRAKKSIFYMAWSTQAARTVKIVVVGTSGHPSVAIDTMTVRSQTTSATPIGSNTVNVSSISGLKSALANNAVDRIVVANGTYRVSPSGNQASNSLWIGGGAIASRTRPVLVQAQTRGGVIFDGGGGSGFSALSFEDGAHNQTWDGFVFANMTAHESGIIEFGGYVPRRTPHDITLQFITIQRSCLGRATYYGAPTLDHAIYVSNAAGVGPYHLLMEDVTVDGRGGLASAVHFDHGDSTNPNATDVIVRRLHVIGTQQALILWTPPVHRITFDDVDVTGAISHVIRFESLGASGVVFSNIRSTGTGYQPFWSSLGLHPAGMTITGSTLN